MELQIFNLQSGPPRCAVRKNLIWCWQQHEGRDTTWCGWLNCCIILSTSRSPTDHDWKVFLQKICRSVDINVDMMCYGFVLLMDVADKAKHWNLRSFVENITMHYVLQEENNQPLKTIHFMAGFVALMYKNIYIHHSQKKINKML